MQDPAWQDYIDKLLRAKLDWEVNVPCRKLGPNRMYPASEAKQNVVARDVCGKCDAVTECLVIALAAEESYGVWGGTSEKQRAILRKQINRATPRSAEERIELTEEIAQAVVKGQHETDGASIKEMEA